jgi:energy-coupling factor transport system substrate-specific component
MRKSWTKYTIAFLFVLIIRLIPFRAPNVEPIMTIIMPLSKTYGKIIAFSFGFLSIVLFDLITSGIGVWTLITGIAYGMLGLGATYYFKNRSGWKSYASYAFLATIFYDAVTGLTIGPLFFNQSFMVSLVGQIPFTLIHLLGNVSFAIVLSPVIERWLVKESKKVVVLEKVLIAS